MRTCGSLHTCSPGCHCSWPHLPPAGSFPTRVQAYPVSEQHCPSLPGGQHLNQIASQRLAQVLGHSVSRRQVELEPGQDRNRDDVCTSVRRAGPGFGDNAVRLLGLPYKCHGLGHLHNRLLFLSVLEAGGPRSRYQPIWFLGEASFLNYRCHRLAVSPHDLS